jgi:hypothetical protein
MIQWHLKWGPFSRPVPKYANMGFRKEWQNARLQDRVKKVHLRVGFGTYSTQVSIATLRKAYFSRLPLKNRYFWIFFYELHLLWCQTTGHNLNHCKNVCLCIACNVDNPPPPVPPSPPHPPPSRSPGLQYYCTQAKINPIYAKIICRHG